jgi:hypothetical protein
MKTLRNSLFAAAGFAILVGALLLGGLQPQEVYSKAVNDLLIGMHLAHNCVVVCDPQGKCRVICPSPPST